MNNVEKLAHKIYDAICSLTTSLIGVEVDSFGINIGESSGIVDGFKGRIVVPFDCVITGFEILEVSETPLISNIQILLDYSSYDDYPSDTVSDIYGVDPPELVDAFKAKSSDVSAWTKIDLAKGDIINVSVSNSDEEAVEIKFVLHVRKV